MKKIFMAGTKYSDKFALVNDEDFDFLNQWKWHYHCKGYASRREYIGRVGNKYKGYMVFMHRVINNTPKGFETDHINRDKLDNRRCNLRTVTRTINQRNKNMYKNNNCGIKGVRWNKEDKRWTAQITVEGKGIILGSFKNAEDAYKKRLEAEKIYFKP